MKTSSFVITTKYQKYFWKPSNIVFQNGGSWSQSWELLVNMYKVWFYTAFFNIYMHMLIRLHLYI